MKKKQVNIDELFTRLEQLTENQTRFEREINELKAEIRRLQIDLSERGAPPRTAAETKNHTTPPPTIPQIQSSQIAKKLPLFGLYRFSPVKSDLEKFIGENLINKIGIIITIIGVGIGAKYAIDHQLISPLTRIILGYLLGLGFLGIAIRLRKTYENFSAVLLSGAMAIMYFITYAAYSFYDLTSQAISFVFMVFFTIFTVIAALNYNKQVIALIGMVGAYAVPLLFSEESGEVAILFSYTAVINTGILAIAFRKYWKSLYYSSFIITWLIYYFWYTSQYQTAEHWMLAFTFLTIFFVIFYIVFLAYKLMRKEKFELGDIVLLLANSFIFYGIGYSLTIKPEAGTQFLGIFTLSNALIHFTVSMIIHRNKLADRNLYYFVLGLVLVFVTIAIPVQLDGNWVTMLWAGEALLLFWLGREKSIPVFEMLSYPLMLLAFFSIIHDWLTVESYIPTRPETRIMPIFNINFLNSLFFITAFSGLNFLFFRRQTKQPPVAKGNLLKIIQFSIPAFLLIACYFTFRTEIATYWNQRLTDSVIQISNKNYTDLLRDMDLNQYKRVWFLIYSMLFLTVLSFINLKKFQSLILGWFCLGASVYLIFIFLTQGLYILSELRESYIHQTLAEYYTRGVSHIIIRYISFLFLGGLIVSIYRYTKTGFLKTNLLIAYDIMFFTTLLWGASSEMIHWMDLFHSTQSYKLGLSLLWGSYSLILIILGIKDRKKYLRIYAIILFSITLLKLFLYDMAHLGTIAKTLLFILLGSLLLIISFLYNKYKHLIFEENEN